ncbi:hypothetical protein AVEN_167249-1 [Araneus ventricosus]|uniref:CCHC-type domain-containing protein n=1 Tax=Araneus ventricosus TaxID=182803 RepID=A0A4Y2S3W6_ARAVE|nr:hypothetical protein AVEN_236702-1 [Araneus ventricosus]GBN82728.1 hypothetical protein AVEN_167249-1 [Araneus ventricosus]
METAEIEILQEVYDLRKAETATLPTESEDMNEPNFDNLQLEDEISELVVVPTQRRRRSSSTSSVSSISTCSQGLSSKIFDDKTPLEDLLSSLRKIINSTTTPQNAKTKPKPRLTVTLQQFANSILDCLEERRAAFSGSTACNQVVDTPELAECATQTDPQQEEKQDVPSEPRTLQEAGTQTCTLLPEDGCPSEIQASQVERAPIQGRMTHLPPPQAPNRNPHWQRSFAQVVSNKQRSTLLLYPKEGSETPIRKLLQEEVNPQKEGIKIAEVRTIRNKGLAVDCETEEHVEKLLKQIETKENLKTAMAGKKFEKRPPRCIIYDVPSSTTEMEVITAAAEASGCDPSKFKFSFRTRERGGKSHCVVMARPEAFGQLMQCRKISINWTRHSFKEHLNIKRCFKCQAFGHLQKECRRKNFYCAFCGFEHNTRNCNSRAPCCANCWEENTKRGTRYPVDHPADANVCPVFHREVTKYKRTVQYKD